VEDNYVLNILEWVGANYPRTFMYDDAHMNVLEEVLGITISNIP
jgi:hypothetical protein